MNLSGGETGISADVGQQAGIRYPDFTPETLASLKEQLPGYATPNNPLDMTASLSYETEKYARALKTVMDDPNIDLVLIGYTLLEEVADPAIHYMAAGMEQVLKGPGPHKPIAMLPYAENTRNPEYQEKLSALGIPILPPPVYGLPVIKYAVDFVGYRPEDRTLDLAIPTKLPSPGRQALSEFDSMKLLREYGIPTPKGGLASTAEEAVAAAAQGGGLGDLHLQHAGGNAVAFEPFGNLAENAVVVQLVHREVDGHGHVVDAT